MRASRIALELAQARVHDHLPIGFDLWKAQRDDAVGSQAVGMPTAK